MGGKVGGSYQLKLTAKTLRPRERYKGIRNYSDLVATNVALIT